MPKYSFEKIAINSREKKKPLDSDKDHYLGLENLDPGTFDVTRFNNEGTPKGEKLIMKKGDVLFGKRRAYQRKVAIAPFDGIFSAHGMVLRPNEDVISKDFFPFFIRSKEFLDRAIAISVGSLSPTINWKDLAKLEFWLPDISVQERAAQALWALEETKKTYLSLTEKMDILIKSRFVELVSTAKGEIPLTKVANVLYGFPFDSSKFNSCGKGTMLIRIRDVNTGLSDTYTTEIADPKYIVKEGDCIAGMDGNFVAVKWTYSRAYLNQRCCKFTPIGVNKEFMLYFLKNHLCEIEEKAQSTTVKHLSAHDINKMNIPNVPIALQKIFSEEALLIDKLKFSIQVNSMSRRNGKLFRKRLDL
jgi:type I restriction enzyme S subunit